MFEIGKTYPIKNIDEDLDGELFIKEQMDERGTLWNCILRLHLNFHFWANNPHSSESPLAFLFKRYDEYWETDEGYVEMWFSGVNKPHITTFADTLYARDVLVAEGIQMHYVDNLNLVERLYEKNNQKSLSPRN